jgi:hypothetical protein
MARTSILAFQAEPQLAGGFRLVAVPSVEEATDFSEKRLAMLVPLGRAAQDHRALAQADEVDFLGSRGAQVAELARTSDTVTGGASGSSFSAMRSQPIFTNIFRIRSNSSSRLNSLSGHLVSKYFTMPLRMSATKGKSS